MDSMKQQLDAALSPLLHNPIIFLVLIVFVIISFALAIRRDNPIALTFIGWLIFINSLILIIYQLFFLPSLVHEVRDLESKIAQLELFVSKDTKAKAAYEAYSQIESVQKKMLSAQALTQYYREFIKDIEKANAGNAQMQFEIGQRYYGGSGYIPKDTNQGLIWVRRSAARGHAEGALWLGRYHQQEQTNDSKALSCYWLSIAARLRHEAATIEAPKLCLTLPRDLQEAIRSNVQAWEPVK